MESWSPRENPELDPDTTKACDGAWASTRFISIRNPPARRGCAFLLLLGHEADLFMYRAAWTLAPYANRLRCEEGDQPRVLIVLVMPLHGIAGAKGSVPVDD